MSVQLAILTRRIEEEIRKACGRVSVPDIVFRVLVEAGYDTSREPSAEEVKPLLLAAYRAAGLCRITIRQGDGAPVEFRTSV